MHWYRFAIDSVFWALMCVVIFQCWRLQRHMKKAADIMDKMIADMKEAQAIWKAKNNGVD